MSEIINIEIKADQSGADEALQQVNKSLKEGTEAAEALNHVLDGDLAGAFKSLGDLSKTLGTTLDLAFDPAEIIAFVQVIAEVTDKLSKLIADTFIYTDAMKEQDKAQGSLNQRWVETAARVKAIGREMQITAEKTQAGKDALRLKFQLEDIGGSPDEIRAKITKIQEEIKKATKDSTETYDIDTEGGTITGFTASAIKAQATVKELNLSLSDLQRQLKESTAVAAQGAQVLANDYAAAADKAAQDEQRRTDALARSAKERAASATQAAIAKAEADKKSGDAEIQQEQQVIRELAAAHQISAEDELSLNKTLLDQKFAQDEAALQKKLEQLNHDRGRNAAQIITVQGEIKTLTVQHYSELEKLDADYYKEVEKNGKEAVAKAAAVIHQKVQQSREAQDVAIKDQIEQDKQASDQEIQLIEQKYDRGKITQQQEIALIAKAKEDELELERLAQQKRFAIWDGDVKKQAEIQAQIDKLVAQSKTIETKAVTDGLKVQEAEYNKVFQGMTTAFTNGINGWLQGTQTFGQAWTKMADDMAIKFIEGLERQVIAFIASEATKDSISAATHAKEGTRTAISAAKHAYDAVVNIPVVGPVLAPIAAGVAFTAVEALGSFDIGSNFVPMDGLAYLHKGEQVIPASQQGPGYSGGNAGITVVVNHSVSAVDAQSFQAHIKRHGNMIGNEVARALKRKGLGK